MGLDMWAYTTAQEIADVDFAAPEDAVEIQYWRKHPNLHGWMERLYRAKGGEDAQFNTVPVRLTREDLVALDKAIQEGKLPYTEGFFFGASQHEHKIADMRFVRNALGAIDSGFRVFYTSWW